MSRLNFVVVACLATLCSSLPLSVPGAIAAGLGPETGIDVLDPVGGAHWSGDRMRGSRERLKDILPGSRG